VAGIGAALITRHDVRVLAQEIDDFALALIAPLGADDDIYRHFLTLPKSLK
jgi:hypothetical protein